MKLLPLALLLSATAPAAAQTARIVHLSHGGSLATLDAAADNFGVVGPYFVADSVRLLTDTTALEYGKWAGYRAKAGQKTRTIQFASRRAVYLQDLRYRQPPVKVVGDTSAFPHKAVKRPFIKASNKPRRKAAALAPLPAAPGGPAAPSGLLLVAGVLLLAGAGWLLAAPDARPLAPA